MPRAHFKNSTVLQTKLTANFPFFASQDSYNYLLSQENENFARQLLFSNPGDFLK